MSAAILNKQNLHEILSSSQPVLIDFWAPWCSPCRMFGPVIDQVAEENAGRVRVVKLNIDEEPEVARQFGVMSIPTLVLIKNGRVAATSVGLKPKQAVEEMIR